MRKDLQVTRDGKEIKFYISSPTADVVSRADRYRAKIWTECIEDGIKTKEELELMMEQRGLWTAAHKKKEKDIVKEIQDLEKQLYLGDGQERDLSEGVSKAIQMRSLRSKLRDHIMQKLTLEQNSAESLADNARFDFLVAHCTFYENGQNVYNGIREYSSQANDEVAFAAASALAEELYSLDTKQEENLPENKWLKHFDLVDEDLSLVDETKHLVDTKGRRINEFGHYINEKGERIDINGNLLDESGNYIITAKYKKKEDKKPRRRTTKKITKKETVDTTDS